MKEFLMMPKRLLRHALAAVVALSFVGYASASPLAGQALDTTVPTIGITSPVDGSTVSGTIVVSGTASDNVKVSKVELRVDSGPYQLATGTTAWSISLNAASYTTGSHTLLARATDSSGNQRWDSETITVASGTDTQIPTVSISSPADGTTVKGKVTVSGTASDNIALSKVEVRIDSDPYQLATGTTAWSYSLDGDSYAGGTHTMTVRATDS